VSLSKSSEKELGFMELSGLWAFSWTHCKGKTDD